MSVLIIDYGMSNLGSIRRAVEECEVTVTVSNNPVDVSLAAHIILPGVGAFSEGMKNIKDLGFEKPIRQAVHEGIPLLGICLGMQLLADVSYENGRTEGFGFIPGTVCLFEPQKDNEKVPHVGWNEINKKNNNILLNNIPDKTDFYFVHSYYFLPNSKSNVIAQTDYCGEFASVINNRNVFGVQFHPEKSGKMGAQLLKNFINFYKVEV